MQTIVYIDALNLYYRAVRDTPYRWLDPVALSDVLLPGHEVTEVKYFTARIKAVPHDPGAPTRQQVYLRALDTVNRLTIEPGFFNRRKSFFALAMGKVGEGLSARERATSRLARIAFVKSGLLIMKGDPIPRIRIWKTEEKGSDVNLASHLLVDGFKNSYQQAAVISNDSDLGWPVRYVRETLGKPVVVLNPSTHRNEHLAPKGISAAEYKRIGIPELEASQLPAELSDAKGQIHRPEGWDKAKKH
ncbi:MAG TPA: NYN domain-containing protein [Solirubrobacterales bacterium]